MLRIKRLIKKISYDNLYNVLEVCVYLNLLLPNLDTYFDKFENKLFC
jgi:hypothetical protein